MIRCVRMWTGEDGDSLFEEGWIDLAEGVRGDSVGDALNPTIDALRRNGSVDFVHVRHEEYGVFAAVAEARLTGNPVCC
jgi:glyoxylate carboligase